MTELKPCPFCGSVDVDIDMRQNVYEIFSPQRHFYSVLCGMCTAEGPPAYNEEQAIARWNERAQAEADDEVTQ